jgi:hypothetical protein
MTRSLVDDLVDRICDRAGEPASGVRYIGCTVAPRDEVCCVRVDAVSQREVDALVDGLALRGARVSEMVDITGTR